MGGEYDLNDPLFKKGEFCTADTVVLLDVQNGLVHRSTTSQ